MRWPLRYKRDPSDAKGIEMAKNAVTAAKQVEAHAEWSAHEHQGFLTRNNLGAKFHAALMPGEGK